MMHSLFKGWIFKFASFNKQTSAIRIESAWDSMWNIENVKDLIQTTVAYLQRRICKSTLWANHLVFMQLWIIRYVIIRWWQVFSYHRIIIDIRWCLGFMTNYKDIEENIKLAMHINQFIRNEVEWQVREK